MNRPKNNPLMIASLLAVAALLCLGLSLRLLAVSGDVLTPLDPASDSRLTTILTVGGGIVIFLFGTISLLAARRYALSASRTDVQPAESLNLVDVRQWSQELSDLRDDLRRDLGDFPAEAELEYRELTIPSSFRPAGHYLLNETGRPNESLADLKRTRDHLLEAAERVDTIVQSINESTSSEPQASGVAKKKPGWLSWWRLS